MTNLIVAFRNFANAPKKGKTLRSQIWNWDGIKVLKSVSYRESSTERFPFRADHVLSVDKTTVILYSPRESYERNSDGVTCDLALMAMKNLARVWEIRLLC
jgi:hypothetical protein